MKRLFLTACLFLGLMVSGMAQNSTSKTDDKAAIAAQKKADKEKKKADKAAAKAAKTAKSDGTNKDGSPDMRLKKNKEAAKTAKTTTTPAPVTPAPKVVTNPNPPQKVTPKVTPAAKTADKVIGPDDKGRTIYEGPRGGRYYINKNGNKEYIKKG